MVEKLAEEFSRLVREELAEHLEEIIERNRTTLSKSCCATHDFCDANMLMAAAFEKVTGNEDDIEFSKEDCALWNEAGTNLIKIQCYDGGTHE